MVGIRENETVTVAPVVKALVWSEPRPPTELCRYNNVTASSALGVYQIEWKGWKEYDSPCVYLDSEYVDSGRDLAAAKAIAQADYEQRVRLIIREALVFPEEPEMRADANPKETPR